MEVLATKSDIVGGEMNSGIVLFLSNYYQSNRMVRELFEKQSELQTVMIVNSVGGRDVVNYFSTLGGMTITYLFVKCSH